MLSIDILLAMATKDLLVKQGIIPADIMNLFFFAPLKNGKCSSNDVRRRSSKCMSIF